MVYMVEGITGGTRSRTGGPRRWVAERSLSWFGRNRHFAKDYENLPATVLSFITLTTIQFGIRRLIRK